MGLRPAKLHEKTWGGRGPLWGRLPTVGPIKGWQAEAPAPPTAPLDRVWGAFSTPSRLAKARTQTGSKNHRRGGMAGLRPAGKLKHAPPFFMKFRGRNAH